MEELAPNFDPYIDALDFGSKPLLIFVGCDFLK